MQKSSSHYESILNATQGRMIWLRFKKHKIAVLSLVLLLILYVVSIFAEFFTPYDIEKRFPGFENAEPSTIDLFDENNEYLGFHFYEFKKTVDQETFEVKFIEDKTEIEILAVGIGHDVSRYYNRAIKITDVNELGDVMISQLSALFDKKYKLN